MTWGPFIVLAGPCSSKVRLAPSEDHTWNAEVRDQENSILYPAVNHGKWECVGDGFEGSFRWRS